MKKESKIVAKKKIKDILDMVQTIEEWAIQGDSETEIARKLGISQRTLRRYKQQDLSLLSALETGKAKANSKVEYALLQRALGYKYEEEQPHKVKEIYYDDNGNKCVRELIQIIKVEKIYPPDVQAQKFWLNNRKAENWKDNPHKVTNDRELLELRKKELESKEW